MAELRDSKPVNRLALVNISPLGEDGHAVDISFTTQNWQKAALDKTRPGQFVRKHFEPMLRDAAAAADISGVGRRHRGGRRAPT